MRGKIGLIKPQPRRIGGLFFARGGQKGAHGIAGVLRRGEQMRDHRGILAAVRFAQRLEILPRDIGAFFNQQRGGGMMPARGGADQRLAVLRVDIHAAMGEEQMQHPDMTASRRPAPRKGPPRSCSG